MRPHQDHTQDVKMVRWHPHRELLVSASYDNSIKVWLEHAGDEEWYCAQTLSSEGASSMPKGQQGDDESDSGVRKDAMYGHTSTVWAVDFSPCGRWLVSVGDDCAVKLWELVTTDGSIHDPVTASADGDHDIHGTSRQPRYIHRKTYPNHHQRPIYTVSWHATTSSSPTTTSTTTTTTNYIATAGGDHCIAVIIDPLTASERIVRVEGAHSSDVNCVAWAPTGAEVDTTTPVLASCSDDGAVKIWEVVNI